MLKVGTGGGEGERKKQVSNIGLLKYRHHTEMRIPENGNFNKTFAGIISTRESAQEMNI